MRLNQEDRHLPAIRAVLRKIAKYGILEAVEDHDQKAARQALARKASRGRKPELYRLSNRRLRMFDRTEFDAMPARRSPGKG